MPIWNPWHGCRKISPGCANCYVYRRDAEFGKDSSQVTKTANFHLAVKRDRRGNYKLQPSAEPVYTCMTSDFFLEEADVWRQEIWQMIRERQDLDFVIITKRIHRFNQCIPWDWGEGYENVTVMCTCEDQQRADERMPVFLEAPIRHKAVIHEPMLGEIHMENYLASRQIEKVICGGESGDSARLCDFAWVLAAREQCVRYGVDFSFKQTGALFKKEEKIYRIPRWKQHEQAKMAQIDYSSGMAGARKQCEKNAQLQLHWEDPEVQKQEADSMDQLFSRLAKSEFRSRFRLREPELHYIEEKGMDTIRRHAQDFVAKRLAPAEIPNDGKQTPMRGHPVFLAQHATACCCRGCLNKWHHIPPGRQLTESEQEYIVQVLMEWIRRQEEK